MKSSLKELLVECIKSSESGLDPAKFPSQVNIFARAAMVHDNFIQILCLSEQIRFTEQCEKAIPKGAYSSLLNDLKGQLESYTAAEPGSPVLQLKLKALILDLIHHIEIVETLEAAGTREIGSWLWQKQLR